MILYYIDESGTGLKDYRSPYFVLSAIAIPAEINQALNQAIIDLKSDMVGWAKPEDFEIKGRDLRRGSKAFKNLDWKQRSQAFLKVATLLADFPCSIFTVQVDTRDLPEYISTDTELYRIAFWRLLDAIEADLVTQDRFGMTLMDARSDLHSSIQDKRTVQAYQDWLHSRGHSHLVDVPWFGFSAFYAGLQMADFTAYLVDFVANEATPDRQRTTALFEAFQCISEKTTLFRIP